MKTRFILTMLSLIVIALANLVLASPAAAMTEMCECSPETGCSVCTCTQNGPWTSCCYACGGASCAVGCPG